MPAKAQLVRWGDTLAIRIPQSVAEAASLSEGDDLLLEAEGKGALAVKAAAQPTTGDELVAGITPQNVHTSLDWEEPAGNES